MSIKKICRKEREKIMIRLKIQARNKNSKNILQGKTDVFIKTNYYPVILEGNNESLSATARLWSKDDLEIYLSESERELLFFLKRANHWFEQSGTPRDIKDHWKFAKTEWQMRARVI